MIRIEHISFEFAAADERFVHDLYADWDGFCRNYFEKTVDECLSPLDKDKVLHEIELLELDLGSIPEENFYREFPRRLKAELLKVLPSWSIPTESERKKTDAPPTPEVEYMRSLVWQELETALAELPPEQREAFELLEMEGLSAKEVASTTGISVNTLLSRKHYAVIHLRKRLKGLYNDLLNY